MSCIEATDHNVRTRGVGRTMPSICVVDMSRLRSTLSHDVFRQPEPPLWKMGNLVGRLLRGTSAWADLEVELNQEAYLHLCELEEDVHRSTD